MKIDMDFIQWENHLVVLGWFETLPSNWTVRFAGGNEPLRQ